MHELHYVASSDAMQTILWNSYISKQDGNYMKRKNEVRRYEDCV